MHTKVAIVGLFAVGWNLMTVDLQQNDSVSHVPT